MNVGTTTLLLLQTYQFPALFLGSFFFGDTVVLAGGFLAGQGVWGFTSVFLIVTAGTVFADIAWFYAGPYLFHSANRLKRFKAHSDRLLPKFERLADRPFRLLVMSKFIYGTRILTIIYVSWKKLPLPLFFVYNLLGTVLYFALLMLIGFLAGKSIINLTPILQDAKYAVTVLLLLIVVFKLMSTWVRRRYEERPLEEERKE